MENGNFISDRRAKDLYDLNFVQYAGLKSAIPKEWVEQLLQDRINLPEITNYDRITAKPNVSQWFNMKITDASDFIPKSAEKCQNILGLKTHQQISTAFRSIYATTNIPKLRSFQFRLLHDALVTNRDLYRWKLRSRSTDKCTFCDAEEETTIHLLVRCNYAKSFWLSVFKLLYDEKFLQNPLTEAPEEDIILNTIHTNKKHCVNFVVLLAKQYIYASKCQGLPLSIC